MKKSEIHTNYGYQVPKDFLEKNKKHLLQQFNKPQKRTHLWYPWAIAASFLILIWWSVSQDFLTIKTTTNIEEDPFVTDLLLETLLLEDERFNEVLAVTLLEEFENPVYDNQ